MSLGLGLGLPYVLGAPGWTPSQLGASLLGWWDAERSDLITQAGGSVSSWKDAVAGYDAAQATGSLKPVYSASSFNSRPGLTFDGVDDYLELASQPFPSSAASCEIWLLADQTALAADTTTRVAFSYGGDASTARRGVQRFVSTGVNRAVLTVGDGATAAGVTETTTDFSGRHVARGRAASSDIRLSLDGGAEVTGAWVPATGASRVRIGAISNTSPGNYWQGVHNTVLVTSALSTAQAAQVLAYLKARGGIS